MKLVNKKIAFLGDSITEGCGASSQEKGFVSIIAKNNPQCKVINYGIGGTRISPQIVNDVYNTPFINRVESMEENCDVVFVFGGTNDYGHGDAPFGNFGDKEPTSFCGALHTLFELLCDKFPNGNIVLLTPIHRFNEDVPHTKPDGGFTLKQYVDMEKRIAEYFAIPVLDLWSVSGIQPNIESNKVRFTVDGLHPNDFGYQHLANIIQTYLENM